MRDFAQAGHQLLVFTCHEHVWRMFKNMNVDARKLPVRGADGELIEQFDEFQAETPEDVVPQVMKSAARKKARKPVAVIEPKVEAVKDPDDAFLPTFEDEEPTELDVEPTRVSEPVAAYEPEEVPYDDRHDDSLSQRVGAHGWEVEFAHEFEDEEAA